MRRKDREITDGEKIDGIINACDCCRLGLNDGGETYIVPLSFGYENKDGGRFFYFHSAKVGRKITVLQKDAKVSFELDCAFKVKDASFACGYTAQYSCVMGRGEITFVENREEKIYALNRIMEHYTAKDSWEFSRESTDKTCVLRLIADSISCKVHE